MPAVIGLHSGVPAALVLVALTALAERLDLVAGRRTRVSLAGPFLVAAALVGGPLVGAVAGASTEAFAEQRPPAQARRMRESPERCRGSWSAWSDSSSRNTAFPVPWWPRPWAS